MGISNETRKERRIDYTKKEISERLNIAETSVDYQLTKLCKLYQQYGLSVSDFKRDGESGRNFFPPDYTELLLVLLKTQGLNPRTKKNTSTVTAEDVSEFNKEIIEEIDSGSLPYYQKNIIQNMPWYRGATVIRDWSSLLVEELTQFVMNLTELQGNDVSQTIKYVCRELDYMNYHLFRGANTGKMILENNEQEQKQIFDGLYKEFLEMDDEERVKCFEKTPVFEQFYNAYKHNEEKLPILNRSDIGVDVGIVSFIKALMLGNGLKETQLRIQKLDEFLDPDEYDTLCNLFEDEVSRNGHLLTDIEREWYLNNKEDVIIRFVSEFLKKPGALEMTIRGKKWESIPDRIHSGTFFEDYHEGYVREQRKITEEEYMKVIMKLGQEEQKKLGEDYLKHYEKNKSNNKELHDIVSRFVGQVLMNFSEPISKKK